MSVKQIKHASTFSPENNRKTVKKLMLSSTKLIPEDEERNTVKTTDPQMDLKLNFKQ